MEKLIGAMFIGIAIVILLFIPIGLSIIKEKEREQAFTENHKKIKPGMEKKQVIHILGNQYTQSYLKGNIEKLEWRYRKPGYTGRVVKGAYVHASSMTRRISVKFKDNLVIEVHSLNMD